ncbi:3-hydroxyacyl-ACP dehydratase FabZ family protein [Streptomyces sp. SR-10]|uniref:3-hydroxyacyl-ACP dehydratase FabZ family protein n=1 Tax=Streptomyces sp. SR-10 TaxID=3416442 RepID=UPI003CEDEE7A
MTAAPAGAGAADFALRPSLVDAAVDVISVERSGQGDGALTAVTTIGIEKTEQLFDGHYADFPIFPGVCVMECVQRSVIAVAERSGMAEPELLAVESTRFLGAVYPGDLLTVHLDVRDDEGTLRCRAKAFTERGDAASVRLRMTGEAAA